MDPVKISSEPQLPVAPMVPGQIPMAMPQPYAYAMPQPYTMPQSYTAPQAPPAPQVPYGITISGLAGPQAPPQAPVTSHYFKPMPQDCHDYSQPRCQVFLDWPTGVPH